MVIGHQRDGVGAFVDEFNGRAERACRIADQDEIKGTGRVVECGRSVLPEDPTGTIVVTMGDVPLLSAETINELTRAHVEADAAVTVVTSVLDDAKAYGRIIRDASGQVERIVEFKDAAAAEHEVRQLRIYAFDATVLRRELARVTSDNSQGRARSTSRMSSSSPAARAARSSPTSSPTVRPSGQATGVVIFVVRVCDQFPRIRGSE